MAETATTSKFTHDPCGPIGHTCCIEAGVADQKRQDLKARTFEFSATLLELYPKLAAGGRAHAHMTDQLFAAGTSIGAMLEEAEVALSRRDMAAKHVVALREARESNYWLKLFARDPKWAATVTPLVDETSQFVAMLTASVRRLRGQSSER